ncbi:MAG: hypothetical protein ACOCV3_02130 [Halanaerobiales bacterium]
MMAEAKKISHILINPLTAGVIAGYITGNIFFGIYTAFLSFLFLGISIYSSLSTILTVLLVMETANINFELIFINILVIVYILQKINKTVLTIIVSVSLYLSVPCWREIFGYIPALILDEINIAGTVILLTGLLFAFKRQINFFYHKSGFNLTFWFFYFSSLILLTICFMYFLPEDLTVIGLGLIISIYLAVRKTRLPELIYFSFILGLWAGRFGLLT